MKRGAALAAGLVVVAGLVGGCAQKPGVAAEATPVSCGKQAEASPPLYTVEPDGTLSWSCQDGAVVRGKSMTVSTTDAADVVALAEASGGRLTGAEAVQVLVEMQTALRAAEKQGVTVSDGEAKSWLKQQSYPVNDGTMVVAKYSVLVAQVNAEVGSSDALAEEQVEAINDEFGDMMNSLDIDVNPRYGTFDPERYAVVPPVWAQNETLLTGL